MKKRDTVLVLDLIQEECAEIIQAISKIRRFGLDNFSPLKPEEGTNREKLTQELGDIMTLIYILIHETDSKILDKNLDIAMERKLEKLKRYLPYIEE